MSPEISRLANLLELVRREDQHLLAVRERLFAGQGAEVLTESWLTMQLGNPDGIDRLESFYAKFSRMQDTLVDKLLPALLVAVGEIPGSAIDNLERASRLGLLEKPDDWIGMRRLRNRLVHEYVEAPADMVLALRAAARFVDKLSAAFHAISDYANSRFTLL